MAKKYKETFIDKMNKKLAKNLDEERQLEESYGTRTEEDLVNVLDDLDFKMEEAIDACGFVSTVLEDLDMENYARYFESHQNSLREVYGDIYSDIEDLKDALFEEEEE